MDKEQELSRNIRQAFKDYEIRDGVPYCLKCQDYQTINLKLMQGLIETTMQEQYTLMKTMQRN